MTDENTPGVYFNGEPLPKELAGMRLSHLRILAQSLGLTVRVHAVPNPPSPQTMREKP